MIGLYDIDLWQSGKGLPNLELMKVYNYYYTNGFTVKMLKPDDNVSPFSKIYYFKENTNSLIPRKIKFNNRSTVLGYGVYNKMINLPSEMLDMPPDYSPYDALTYKIKSVSGVDYDGLQKSSLVRFENEDFSDFSENKSRIISVDHNIISIPKIHNLLQKYKNYNIYLYNEPEIKTPEQLELFIRYSEILHSRGKVCYNFSKEEFLNNYREKLIFKIFQNENETDEGFMCRHVKLVLQYKKNNLPYPYQFFEAKFQKGIYKEITKWFFVKTQQSFYNYSNSTIKKQIVTLSTPLRLLLKQDPKSYYFDFF